MIGLGKLIPFSFKEVRRAFAGVVENLLKQVTQSGATGRDQELADISLANQQQLNEEDYQRKIDFYERYESYPAQVRQMKQAGLNPAMMYGGSPSASASGGIGAGSADASASSAGQLGSLLTGILGAATKMEQINTDRALTSDANDIRRYQAETERQNVVNYGKYLEALTTGQNQRNDVFYQLFDLQVRETEGKIVLSASQARYFDEVANSEFTRRALMESGINLNDKQAALLGVQKAIAEAQAKYAERYFKAVADVQELIADMTRIDKQNYERLNEKDLLYQGAVAELANLIFDAGMKLDVWEGEAFKKSISGEMTKKDWTQAVMGVIKSIIAGGAVVGASAIRSAARGIVPPQVWSPQQQYMFYNATGSRYDTTM